MKKVMKVLAWGVFLLGLHFSFSVAKSLWQEEKTVPRVAEERNPVTEQRVVLAARPVRHDPCVSYSQVFPTIRYTERYIPRDFVGPTDPEEQFVILDQMEEMCLLRPALLQWFEHQPDGMFIYLYNILELQELEDGYVKLGMLRRQAEELAHHQLRGVDVPVGYSPGTVGIPVSWTADNEVSKYKITKGSCVSVLSSDQSGLNTVNACYLLFLLVQGSYEYHPEEDERHDIYVRLDPFHRPLYVLYCSHYLRKLGNGIRVQYVPS